MNQSAIAYHNEARESTSARYHVAAAWIDGNSASGTSSPQYRHGPTFRTDGTTLWSYDHVVGVTTSALNSQGTRMKVAYACHYSPTTTKQLGPAKAMADIVVECESCKELRRVRSAGMLATNR